MTAAHRLAEALAARGYPVPGYVIQAALFDAGIRADANLINVAVHDHLNAHAALGQD